VEGLSEQRGLDEVNEEYFISIEAYTPDEAGLVV
jgi:hypothetical protein